MYRNILFKRYVFTLITTQPLKLLQIYTFMKGRYKVMYLGENKFIEL